MTFECVIKRLLSSTRNVSVPITESFVRLPQNRFREVRLRGVRDYVASAWEVLWSGRCVIILLYVKQIDVVVCTRSLMKLICAYNCLF